MTVTALSTARADERELFVRYQQDDDLAARRELVERYLPFTRGVAHRYAYTGEPVDDLVQVASMGLLKAIDRFEPDRPDASFKSYAAPTILGELKRHFRDTSWALRVPRGLKERVLQAQRTSEALTARLGRRPSIREVAGELGCSVEELLEAHEASRSHDSASLDAPVAPGDDGDDGDRTLGDRIGGRDPGYEAFEDQSVLAAAWHELPALERRILALRFFEGLTQSEIGERVGYSQMQVSRLMRRALAQLEQSPS
jgi:RNA polymerase sigma-B factor